MYAAQAGAVALAATCHVTGNGPFGRRHLSAEAFNTLLPFVGTTAVDGMTNAFILLLKFIFCFPGIGSQ